MRKLELTDSKFGRSRSTPAAPPRDFTDNASRARSSTGSAKLVQTAAIILVLSFISACRPKASSNPGSYFPASADVAGWDKTGETRIFPADRLWEYIDGDAEKFIRAGVERAETADYRYQNKIDAVADIFVMSAPSGAAQVFESQPAAGSQTLPLGDAARLYKGSLMLRKGRFFVRLVAFSDAPEVPEALTALGRGIASRLE